MSKRIREWNGCRRESRCVQNKTESVCVPAVNESAAIAVLLLIPEGTGPIRGTNNCNGGPEENRPLPAPCYNLYTLLSRVGCLLCRWHLCKTPPSPGDGKTVFQKFPSRFSGKAGLAQYGSGQADISRVVRYKWRIQTKFVGIEPDHGRRAS